MRGVYLPQARAALFITIRQADLADREFTSIRFAVITNLHVDDSVVAPGRALLQSAPGLAEFS
jgi:hypothetical protein